MGGILIFPPKQYKENDANLKRVKFSNFKNKGCIPTEGNQQKCARQFQSGLMNECENQFLVPFKSFLNNFNPVQWMNEWMNVKIDFGSF